MLHFSYEYCIKVMTDKKILCLCVHYEECSDVNGGLNSLWRWRHESPASPVHSVTFVHISGCDHLCLFSLFWNLFVCRRWLSALCLNLNLDRMYSFNLQRKWNNDKIRMVKKKNNFGSVFIGSQVENLILVYSTVNLAELHIISYPVEKQWCIFFKCGIFKCIQQCEI